MQTVQFVDPTSVHLLAQQFGPFGVSFTSLEQAAVSPTLAWIKIPSSHSSGLESYLGAAKDTSVPDVNRSTQPDKNTTNDTHENSPSSFRPLFHVTGTANATLTLQDWSRNGFEWNNKRRWDQRHQSELSISPKWRCWNVARHSDSQSQARIQARNQFQQGHSGPHGESVNMLQTYTVDDMSAAALFERRNKDPNIPFYEAKTASHCLDYLIYSICMKKKV